MGAYIRENYSANRFRIVFCIGKYTLLSISCDENVLILGQTACMNVCTHCLQLLHIRVLRLYGPVKISKSIYSLNSRVTFYVTASICAPIMLLTQPPYVYAIMHIINKGVWQNNNKKMLLFEIYFFPIFRRFLSQRTRKEITFIHLLLN